MSEARLTTWAPLRPDAYLRRPARSLPFPLEQEHCRTYELGRHGLWHGLRALGIGAGDEVLVPAHHHGSEVEVLRLAGVTCRFFEGDEDLAPSEAELEGLIRPSTRALYLTHYLGFAQAAPRWRRWCDKHGLLLIEDVAMSWLATLEGRPLGSWGDLSFYSPWKTYGLPDLGAAICRKPSQAVDARPRLRVKRLVRSHGVWLGGRWAWIAAAHRQVARTKPFVPQEAFALGYAEATASASSLFLLRRLCAIDAAGCRRANYARLLEVLGQHVPRPFQRLQEGACPFVFPVRTADKRGMLESLAASEIVGLDLWAVPHPTLPLERFPGSARRRSTLVGLPVHQELRSSDLERVAEVAGEFLQRGDAAGTATEAVGGAV